MSQNGPIHPLRAWRTAQNLTLEDAAGRVGTVRQVWFGWETGKYIPGPKYMPKVRTLTGLSADDFYNFATETRAAQAA